MSYCISRKCSDRENSNDVDVCQSCGTPLLINHRYRVLERLFHHLDAPTEVFEVQDLQDNNTIKVLKTLHREHPQLIKLFAREQDILIRHRHEGIPKGEAAFIVLTSKGEELPCLVMEKIAGQNLKEYLEKEGKIHQFPAIDWLKQIVNILDFIHNQKPQLLHRDIKPSNIMRRPDGKLVLIDFGIAREILADGTLTGCGTPGYVAPEQWEGKSVAQSDFYALGQTFKHLLTGIHPLGIEDNLITQSSSSNNSIWHQQIQPPISQPLVDLINWLTKPSPQHRPPNTKVILQRLHEIEHPKLQRRWLKARLVATGIAALGIGVGIISIVFPPRACNNQIQDNFSCGEETLIPGNVQSKKAQGILQLKRGNYAEAVKFLEAAWQQQRDPETLIYLNNARIELGVNNKQISADKVYTIAVAVPLANTPQTQNLNAKGLEVLRGIAHSQNQVIKNGLNLKVLIANDGDNPEQAEKIAKQLINKPDILAVVGHLNSEVTKKAKPIYEQGRIVLISGTSTSAELNNDPDKNNDEIFFFRTTPTVYFFADAIKDYLLKQPQPAPAAVFASSNSFARSFKQEFTQIYGDKTIDIGEAGVLSNNNFDANLAIKEAKQQEASTILLVPDGGTTAYGLENALKVIKSKQKPLLLLGATSLYDPKVLIPEAVNRLIIVASWYSRSSTNGQFLKDAKELWGTQDVSWRTAFTYDATLAVTQAVRYSPDRLGVQRVLSDPNFQISGSAGLIQFDKGNLKFNPSPVLVKVVPKCQGNGFTFTPVENREKCQ